MTFKAQHSLTLNSHSKVIYLLLLYKSLSLLQLHSLPPVSQTHQTCFCPRTFALHNSTLLLFPGTSPWLIHHFLEIYIQVSLFVWSSVVTTICNIATVYLTPQHFSLPFTAVFI